MVVMSANNVWKYKNILGSNLKVIPDHFQTPVRRLCQATGYKDFREWSDSCPQCITAGSNSESERGFLKFKTYAAKLNMRRVLTLCSPLFLFD